MKKTLIAAAALAATGAFAQSSVTLYGLVDAGIYSGTKVGTGGKDAAYFADSSVSSSVWGLRGSEDLGGGLKANFHMEGDIQTNNGGNNQNGMFRRAANVGLAGAFGAVDFGLKQNPLITAHGSVLPMGGNSVTTNAATAGGYNDFFTRNAITYLSPVFAGFQLQFQHGAANNIDSNADGSMNGYHLSYTNGNLVLRLAGHDRKGNGATSSANTGLDADTQLLGASYKWGNFALGAMGITNREQAVAGGAKVQRTLTAIGGSYDMTPAVKLGVNLYNGEGSTLTNLQARYSLSKRTTGYVQYGLANNGKDGRVNFFPAVTNTGTATAPVLNGLSALTDTTQSALGVGIIHTF